MSMISPALLLIAVLACHQSGDGPSTVVGTAPGPLRLTPAGLRVAIPVSAAADKTLNAPLAGQSVYLVLRDIRGGPDAAGTFTIYLNLPDHATERDRDVSRVGTLTIFGAPSETLTREAAGDEMFRSYDITPVLPRVRGGRNSTQPLSVTIEADNVDGRAAVPVIERLEIVRR